MKPSGCTKDSTTEKFSGIQQDKGNDVVSSNCKDTEFFLSYLYFTIVRMSLGLYMSYVYPISHLGEVTIDRMARF